MTACAALIALLAGCAEAPPPPPEPIEPFDIPTAPPIPEPDESGPRYVARWNAWVATLPPESIGRIPQRVAVDEFREICNEVGETGGWYTREALDSSKPGDEDWEATAALFELLEPQLDAMARAISAEWFVGSIEISGPINPLEPPVSRAVTELLIDSSISRSAARHLGSRARHRMLLRDSEGFVDDLLAMIDSKRQTRQPPLLAGYLTECALDSYISSLLLRSLAANPDFLNLDQLGRISDALHEIGGPDLVSASHTEGAIARWTLEHIFADNKGGRLSKDLREQLHHRYDLSDAWRPDEAAVLNFPDAPPSPPRYLATLDEHLVANEQLQHAFTKLVTGPSDGTLRSPIRQFVERYSESGQADHLYLVMQTAPWLRSQASICHRYRLGDQALRCVIAVHEHRHIHGQWPATLEELESPALAIDPYTNEPFHYSLDASGPKLWAAGPDRDDDRGREIEERYRDNTWFTLDEWELLSEEVRQTYDGDIILFPPEPEAEPEAEPEPDRDDP